MNLKVAEGNDWCFSGVNSFGFGGGNCHVLLKWNTKIKRNGGEPLDNLPRLVCASARTEETLNNILLNIESGKLDAEYTNLWHNIFR